MAGLCPVIGYWPKLYFVSYKIFLPFILFYLNFTYIQTQKRAYVCFQNKRAMLNNGRNSKTNIFEISEQYSGSCNGRV